MGENIGAAARVMLNFGFADLRLVAPRDGWPNPMAQTMAAGADAVIGGAEVYSDLAEAIADRGFVAATTARPRGMLKPVLNPREAGEELRRRSAAGVRCAVVFGAERSGLTTEDVARCDVIVMADVNPDFPSLNLAQAVALLAYECAHRSAPEAAQPLAQAAPADKDELFAFFAHLEQELAAAGYFFPEEKRRQMERNLRTMFTRAALTSSEVQTLRGVVKTLAEGRRSGLGGAGQGAGRPR